MYHSLQETAEQHLKEQMIRDARKAFAPHRSDALDMVLTDLENRILYLRKQIAHAKKPGRKEKLEKALSKTQDELAKYQERWEANLRCW